jgi:hypothetical protein
MVLDLGQGRDRWSFVVDPVVGPVVDLVDPGSKESKPFEHHWHSSLPVSGFPGVKPDNYGSNGA